MSTPGVRYTPDHVGFLNLMQSDGIGNAAVQAAEAGRAWAQRDDPDGEYEVSRQTVIAGRPPEPRAGAALESTKASAGGRRRTLVRSVSVIEAKP